ncbi:MAG: hypothetical protein AB1499_16625 [Nitrospirota bacterium]
MKEVLNIVWKGILILGAIYFILDAFIERPPIKEFGLIGFIALVVFIAYLIRMKQRNTGKGG